MDGVIRVAVLYGFLTLLFRLVGRRTLSEATTFDLLLVLIISETTQQAMVGEDHSLTHAFVLIATLVGCDLVLSVLKYRFPRLDRIMEGAPIVLVESGKPLPERMKAVRVDVDDILEAARASRGLERLDQIKFAVMERTGEITIIPRRSRRTRA